MADFDGKWMSRDDELAFLRQELVTRRRPVVQIVGPRGSGKTALSLNFIESNAGAFSGIQRFWETDGLNKAVSVNLPANQTDQRLVVLDEVPEITLESDVFRRLGEGWNRQVLLVSTGGLDTSKVGGVSTLTLTDVLTANNHITSASLLLETTSDERRRIAELFDQPMRWSEESQDEAPRPFISPGLVDPYGNRIAEGSPEQRSVIELVSTVNEEFLKRLDQYPEEVHGLSSRHFEEVVAEMMRRLGYTVELTPATRDGGKDIYVARETDLGSFMFLVECKKYAPDNPVGVHVVRELYGTVIAERATAGILATTSRFTKGAVEFQSKVSSQLALKDYVGVQKWLRASLANAAAR